MDMLSYSKRERPEDIVVEHNRMRKLRLRTIYEPFPSYAYNAKHDLIHDDRLGSFDILGFYGFVNTDNPRPKAH